MDAATNGKTLLKAQYPFPSTGLRRPAFVNIPFHLLDYIHFKKFKQVSDSFSFSLLALSDKEHPQSIPATNLTNVLLLFFVQLLLDLLAINSILCTSPPAWILEDIGYVAAQI